MTMLPPTVRPTRLSHQRNSAFVIKLAADETGADYAGSCSSVRADPAGAASTFVGMKPDATYSESAGWNLVFTFADDYDNAASLWNLLFDHEGEQAEIDFYPDADGVGYRTTASLKSGGVGGTAREVATSTVTLECSKPTKLPDPTP